METKFSLNQEDNNQVGLFTVDTVDKPPEYSKHRDTKLDNKTDIHTARRFKCCPSEGCCSSDGWCLSEGCCRSDGCCPSDGCCRSGGCCPSEGCCPQGRRCPSDTCRCDGCSTCRMDSCCSCFCRSNKPNRRRRRKQTCAMCCRRTIAFFFSHIGLCSLVVAYSVAGGFIFRELESAHELRERDAIVAMRGQYVRILWNYTRTLNILYPENWTAAAERTLTNFQREIYVGIKEGGWDGKEGPRELQWSFIGSLLYSVTVITTIGYGNIAPKTSYGRLVTILYAIVGIPLTLLCLTNIGSFLGDCFRFLYKHTCRCCMWTCLPSGHTTIWKPTRKRGDRIAMSEVTRSLTRIEERIEEPDGCHSNWDGERVAVVTEDFVSGCADDDVSEDTERIRVPICVCLLLMAVYIQGGALLFSFWEDKWSYLIGSYFCFITLSTIGFGDFVPGASTDSWSNKQKSVICALYLIFGLALIAMCFNLMQEEVRSKFRWLAQKLRLVDTGDNERK